MSQIRVISMRDATADTEIEINTTSRSKNWSKGLSPFYVGPCVLYGGRSSRNVENAWQYTKVYEWMVDSDGEPTKHYWDWAAHGWASTWAHRYPAGRGAVPLYSLWDGERLDYIEARKKIYVPLYSSCVRGTIAYQELQRVYRSRESFALRDFDGYDYEALGMTLDDVLNDPTRKMGHAFVLAMMLERRI